MASPERFDRSSFPRRCETAFLAVLALCVAALVSDPGVLAGDRSEVGGLALVRDGRPGVTVVVAPDASSAELTAANELAEHLLEMTGIRFEVTVEGPVGVEAPTIEVGWTAFVRGRAGPLEHLEAERWFVRTTEGRLLLYGGRPRGTLYAVYRFLEDEMRVRWWTPYERFVPPNENPVVAPVDRSGRPAFAYRDVHGIEGPRAFPVRSRANGHYTRVGREYGGRERYGPPAQAHTFYPYLPPGEFFASHPEYYSLIDGARTADRAQLCLTNEGVFERIAERLEVFIASAEREAEHAGETPPRLFGISQNDFGRPCECDRCSDLLRRYGGHSGSIVVFLNRLADRIAVRHPDVRLDTLAYLYSLDPPRGVRLRENVVVRLANLQYRNFLRPVTHPDNARYRRAIEGWAEVAPTLRIWDYTVTYPRETNLPLPNLGVIAADLAFYRSAGVEGVFVQHDHPIEGDLRDLKAWVLFRLLEDPARDLGELEQEFTDGYYGPAGRWIRQYLRELERVAARSSLSMGYPARLSDFDYLDLGFTRRAHRLFDLAEAAVSGTNELGRRVRHARLSLDRATLARMRGLGREWDDRGRRANRRPPEPREVARRYLRTWSEQLDLRIPQAARRQARLDEVVEEVAGWLLGPGARSPVAKP